MAWPVIQDRLGRGLGRGGPTEANAHHLKRDSTATDSCFSPHMKSAAAKASAQDNLQALP